ncbi:MAG: Gfo/Idh/MocA family oxidoreductase [Verrucomicrobia bacterium]|nr:Gfo/Idh/MocA family oxidoreductase [Verrucomicrobiota bacterium]
MSSERRKIRAGMVGGGPGAGIGETHRIAMRLDDRYELVAGAFSRDHEKSLAAGRQFGISVDRVYPDYATMAERERERDDRIDTVVIVTPTDKHYEVAKAFAETGINIICDKPLCLSLREARELKALADKTKIIFCLTHNYSGYAMVRHAGRMVRDGQLGEVRVIQAEHASGWAIKLLEKEGHKQAAWRTDPNLSGDASVLYDLGTHAHQLARFITGLEVSEVAAELSHIVQGRAIKDNANLLLRFTNGARGTLWASMAAVGNEHGLAIRVYGERGSLAWRHEDPQHLQYFPIDAAPQILAQGADWLSSEARRWTRAGLGHPEGFFEAFANLYTELADALLARSQGRAWKRTDLSFPDINDGVHGIAFVECAMHSYAAGGAWTKIGSI